MHEKMKSNNILNIDMSIKFFEDLVIMLKELKDFKNKEQEKNKLNEPEDAKKIKI